MTERRFDERLGPILLAIAFFGAGGGWLAWMMFVAGGNSDMILEFLNPTSDNPIAWLGVVLCSIMVLMALWRLLFGRDVVVFEPEQVRFGYAGRKMLPRDAVAKIEVLDPDGVWLHLRDDVDEVTRRRAGVRSDEQTWVPLVGQFKEADELPAAVAAWVEGR